MRSCATCGSSLEGRRKDARVCSKRCADIRRGAVRADAFPARPCALPGCGAEFIPKREMDRCCSERHGKALWNREARAEGRASDPWSERRRANYARRRALKAGSAVGAPFTSAEVFERDGWLCGLCSQPVDSAVEYPDPASASLDHVVPLSRGGEHSLENVQLAHLSCNVSKGAAVA